MDQSGDTKTKRLVHMYETALEILIQKGNLSENFLAIVDKKDRVGIKINTIGGKKLSTSPDVSHCLASLLAECGLSRENIVIWDRTNRELKQAGYRLNMNNKSIKVFGTDTNGVGYEKDLVSHFNIGSLFSQIQARYITASISLAILKDHGLAGVTAGMKNYFGAIHNPNKYHDTNCNPFVAELFDTDSIKRKHKLSIIDALIVQYHISDPEAGRKPPAPGRPLGPGPPSDGDNTGRGRGRPGGRGSRSPGTNRVSTSSRVG